LLTSLPARAPYPLALVRSAPSAVLPHHDLATATPLIPRRCRTDTNTDPHAAGLEVADVCRAQTLCSESPAEGRAIGGGSPRARGLRKRTAATGGVCGLSGRTCCPAFTAAAGIGTGAACGRCRLAARPLDLDGQHLGLGGRSLRDATDHVCAVGPGSMDRAGRRLGLGSRPLALMRQRGATTA